MNCSDYSFLTVLNSGCCDYRVLALTDCVYWDRLLILLPPPACLVSRYVTLTILLPDNDRNSYLL